MDQGLVRRTHTVLRLEVVVHGPTRTPELRGNCVWLRPTILAATVAAVATAPEEDYFPDTLTRPLLQLRDDGDGAGGHLTFAIWPAVNSWWRPSWRNVCPHYRSISICRQLCRRRINADPRNIISEERRQAAFAATDVKNWPSQVGSDHLVHVLR